MGNNKDCCYQDSGKNCNILITNNQYFFSNCSIKCILHNGKLSCPFQDNINKNKGGKRIDKLIILQEIDEPEYVKINKRK